MQATRWAGRTVEFALVVALVIAFSTSAMAAERWHPSKWGADDELGSFNMITSRSVLEAMKLVKVGKTYNLGIVIDDKLPAFPPRKFQITILQPNQITTGGLGPTNMSYNDEVVTTWLGIGPQIDGLGHVGINHVYYNGNKAKDFAKVTGVTKLGMEKLPPIIGRGVVLDMAGYYGVNVVKEGTPYTREDIIGAAKRQGVEIRKGDIVIFNAGWLNLLDGADGMTKPDPKRWGSAEPGIGLTGAKYLIEKDVMAVGADTWGVEAVPFEKGVGVFEIHQWLIAKNGIYMLESMDTRGLVKDRAWEFLFVLGVVRMRGAVQMMINPVAIR